MSGRVERPEERLARRRLEPRLGPLEPADVPGTSGLPDYRILGREVPRGHVEVTSRPDGSRKEQRTALRKRPDFTVPTPGRWSLYLFPRVDIRDLARSPELVRVLDAAKTEDRLITLGNAEAELDELMHSLGIEAVRCWDANSTPGIVSLSGGTTGAKGVQGEGVDQWLEAAFQEPSVVSHVEKLRRAGGGDRHLYLEVDSTSEKGLAIAISLDASGDSGAATYRLPAFEPPDALTDLWVWPDCPSPGLHFARDRGWEIVEDVPWE